MVSKLALFRVHILTLLIQSYKKIEFRVSGHLGIVWLYNSISKKN
jgi:hypothetical protein